MKFYETDLVKTALKLDDVLFDNENNNIDIVNKKARDCYYGRNFDQALQLVSSACNLVDRFHSYFHYEQSYVYTRLGEIYAALSNIPKAIEYLDKAIFQDHLNFQAINKIIACYYKQNKLDNYKYWQERAEKLGIIDVSIKYQPEFAKFEDFVIFAAQNSNIQSDNLSYFRNNTHYHYNDIAAPLASEGKLELAKDNYQKSIEILELAHSAYHSNAAKIFINRHLVYLALGKNDLAKNDLEKASNLDSSFIK